MLSEEMKIVQVVTITTGAAAASAINSTIVDTAGFDGLMFVVQFGTIVAGAATSIKAQQDTDPAGGTMADLAGSNQTIVDTADDTVFYIDLKRFTKRYVRLVISRATQNATVSAMAYLYRGRTRPVTHGAGISGERWANPVEGTA